MTAKELEQLLVDSILSYQESDHEWERADVFDFDSKITDISTFEEVGVLTTNPGLVITLPDGSEFQVSIVQSR